jgi:hypothetical protein
MLDYAGIRRVNEDGVNLAAAKRSYQVTILALSSDWAPRRKLM